MKILYLIHQYFPRHVGGSEVYLQAIAENVTKLGHNVQIVTCHENPSPHSYDFHTEQTNHNNIPVTEIHFNLSVTKNSAKSEYNNDYVYNVVQEILKEFKPDLIHVIHAMKLSGSALKACHDANIPVIVTLCDFWFICPRHTLLKWDNSLCDGPKHPLQCRKCLSHPHNFASFPTSLSGVTKFFSDLHAIKNRNDFLKEQLLNAKRIFALSPFQKKMFINNGYPSDRIELLSHGLVTTGLENIPRKSSDDELRLGFIGSLVDFKGAHILVEALALIPEVKLSCKIYGPLLENSYVENLKKAVQNDSRIELMDRFPPEKMGEVMSQFDFLVMPALWYENEPLVVKASLYLQKWIIASNIGSLTDMITHGKNGWLVEPGNIQAWAESIKRIASASLPEYHPTKVKTIQENVNELLAIYEDCLPSPSTLQQPCT